jgi:RNA polymerase sigma-70 factor (ECF subfamily)
MIAQQRDADYLARLEPHRRAITAHCYRMLGSLHDAEDVTQDVLLRAWQRLAEVKSADSTRAWLYKIGTNACLDLLKSRRRRTLPHLLAAAARPDTPLGPPQEEIWVEPAPDALFDLPDDAARGPEAQASLRESVSLAFITALQYLPPKQRAVLVLIDVLEWQPPETSELLKTSVASVNSLLQRARRGIRERAPNPESPSQTSSADEETLVQRYVETWESGDLAAFSALLAEDATLSMPPLPQWFAGREDIRQFLVTLLPAWPAQFRLVPLRANGSPAIAVYRQEAVGGAHEAHAIISMGVRGGHIAQLIAFAMPDLFRLLGLPDQLPVGTSTAT